MSYLVGALLGLRLDRRDAEIHFFSDAHNGLAVTMETDRLHIRSVEATEAEYDRYAVLFGKKDVMATFATGQTKTREEMKVRVNGWVQRWREHDPYSGFAVFKKGTNDFVGHVVLGHGDHPGEAGLGGLGDRDFWRRGYGYETAVAIVHKYALATLRKGYLLEGKPLVRIVATARLDNVASIRILEKIGLKYCGKGEKYGAIRSYYAIEIGQLGKKFTQSLRSSTG